MVVETSTIMIRCYKLVEEDMEEMTEHRERQGRASGFRKLLFCGYGGFSLRNLWSLDVMRCFAVGLPWV